MSVNDVMLEFCHLAFGVQQGSMLRPLVFWTYTLPRWEPYFGIINSIIIYMPMTPRRTNSIHGYNMFPTIS